MNIEIKEFIKQKSIYGEYFFLNGGCYIFARILKKKYGGDIYSNCDHCVLKLNNKFYDIRGEVENKNYIPIDRMEEERYINYNNF